MVAERSRSAHVTLRNALYNNTFLGCKTRGLRQVPLGDQGAEATLEGFTTVAPEDATQLSKG